MRELRRVAREELEGTLKELLTVNDQARSIAVHEARKHLKKARALIRLLRPAAGKAFYKRENAAMRKAAQRMSSIRDSHVRVQTIKKLIEKYGDPGYTMTRSLASAGRRQRLIAFRPRWVLAYGKCLRRVKRTIGVNKLPLTWNRRFAVLTTGL